MYKNTHFILVHISSEKCLEMLTEGEKIRKKFLREATTRDLGAAGGGGAPYEKYLQFITR